MTIEKDPTIGVLKLTSQLSYEIQGDDEASKCIVQVAIDKLHELSAAYSVLLAEHNRALDQLSGIAGILDQSPTLPGTPADLGHGEGGCGGDGDGLGPTVEQMVERQREQAKRQQEAREKAGLVHFRAGRRAGGDSKY